MANVPNGGTTIPGNLSVLGNGDINGDLNVDGSLTVGGALSVTGALTADSVNAGSLALTPRADPPDGAGEGTLYADTDHKLYYHNGTSFQEIAFA